MEKTEVLIEGIVERIAIEGSFIKYETENGKNKIETEIPNHTVGLEKVLDAILNVEKVITDKSEIDAIGHRVVHG
jgi:acetate kinase